MLALLAWISYHVDEETEKRESAGCPGGLCSAKEKGPLEKARQGSAGLLGDGAEGKPLVEAEQSSSSVCAACLWAGKGPSCSEDESSWCPWV